MLATLGLVPEHYDYIKPQRLIGDTAYPAIYGGADSDPACRPAGGLSY